MKRWKCPSDMTEVTRILWEQVPAVLAHEMFHYWRHVAGCITEDYWHEEWAANQLAVAYARQYANDVLVASVQLAERIAVQLSARARITDPIGQPREPDLPPRWPMASLFSRGHLATRLTTKRKLFLQPVIDLNRPNAEAMTCRYA